MSRFDRSAGRSGATSYATADMTLRLSNSGFAKRAALAEREQRAKGAASSPFVAPEQSVVQAIERVRATVELRKRRDAECSGDCFGEPAWEILLDLFLERAAGRKTNSMSAATASRAPITTALRYLGILEKRGLITKRVAEHDLRVHYVQLTDDTYQWMINLFAD